MNTGIYQIIEQKGEKIMVEVITESDQGYLVEDTRNGDIIDITPDELRASVDFSYN